MLNISKTSVMNIDNAIRGARNPMNSWAKSDSYYDEAGEFHLGDADIVFGAKLCRAGTDHRKFIRQIFVSVDIEAPLYWWKEFDTYKIGTVANSTSTMHKIQSNPITLDCFEIDDFNNVPYPKEAQRKEIESFADHDVVQMVIIPYLEYLRQMYLATKDKVYWKELIRWLPEGWLQTRTITMNYQVIRQMYFDRRNHKLTEWRRAFIDWVKVLPYAEELIMYEGD